MIRATIMVLAVLAGAKTPHAAVLRFIENHSPADACAQLAPAYKQAIGKQYGPCLQGMRVQPKATHVHTSHERIHGSTATVDAAYDVNGQHFREIYTLVRRHGVWLITGSRQLP